MYLFCNWLYKCVAKTMLCLTEKEIYKEKYLPFKRAEITIPLNKVTSVSTMNVLWIFRSVIIRQYGKIPMIFFTWNNKEFKDKVTELIANRKEEIKNEYKDKNLINDTKLFILIAGAIVLIVLLFGIVKLFNLFFSPSAKISGTYSSDSATIVLKKTGSCKITEPAAIIDKCNWNYNEENENVTVIYEYDTGISTTSQRILNFKYDKENNTLSSGRITVKKN